MGLRIMTEPQAGASYDDVLAVARTTEECGFDAFFRSDHILRFSDPPASAYTDAWTTLAGLARDTSTIRLGAMVTPVTFRPVGTFPLVVGQIDHMSGGRIDVGLGAGWFDTEHAAYGLPFPEVRERYDLLEDQLAVLHGVWNADAGSTFDYEGRTLKVSLEVDPLRPAQRPHPPIITGGLAGPRNRRLTATYADEFNVPFMPIELMADGFRVVREACEAHGRDPDSLVYSACFTVCCGESEAELTRRAAAIGQPVDVLRQHQLCGTPAEVIDRLGALAGAGAERFYLQVPDLSDLDHLRLIAEQVQPHAPGC